MIQGVIQGKRVVPAVLDDSESSGLLSALLEPIFKELPFLSLSRNRIVDLEVVDRLGSPKLSRPESVVLPPRTALGRAGVQKQTGGAVAEGATVRKGSLTVLGVFLEQRLNLFLEL